jgi:hypothetical protein
MPRGINQYDERRLQGLNLANANSVNIISPGGIVTDGQVLHVDAGNFHSYPLTGTTWYDISGRRENGNFNNSPTYSRDGAGSISFSSIAFIRFANLTLTNKSCTICMWLKANNAGQYTAPFSLWLASGTHIWTENTTKNYYWLGGGFTGGPLLFNHTGANYDYIVTTFDATNATCYKNAVQTAQTASSDFDTTTFGVNLAVRNGQNFWSGNIAAFTVYNRPLLQEEVSQNFNATRARFGI